MTPGKRNNGRTVASPRTSRARTGGRKSIKGRSGKASGKPSMPRVTYVEDRGAVYDAPMEVVWDFMLNDEKYHPKAHRSDVRNFEGKELSDVSILLSYEQKEGGKWKKRVCRMTTVRPAVRVQEDLIGPFAGSKTVFLYTPRGDQTVVDVFGYVQSSELNPAEIKRERKKIWSNAYSEDLPYFRKFAKEHVSGGGKRR